MATTIPAFDPDGLLCQRCTNRAKIAHSILVKYPNSSRQSLTARLLARDPSCGFATAMEIIAALESWGYMRVLDASDPTRFELIRRAWTGAPVCAAQEVH